jgi:hypothetical protein
VNGTDASLNAGHKKTARYSGSSGYASSWEGNTVISERKTRLVTERAADAHMSVWQADEQICYDANTQALSRKK